MTEHYGSALAKAERAKTLLREKPWLSLRAIARECGTSHGQIARIKSEMEEEGFRPPDPETALAAIKKRDIDELVAEVSRLLSLEEENVRLRQRLAQLGGTP